MNISCLNKSMVTVFCSISLMCMDAKGSEENDVGNVNSLQIKTANIEHIDPSGMEKNDVLKDISLNTNAHLSTALDQLFYSPLQNAKTLITSFCKFAYEKPAMAAITTTYFMLPIVAAYGDSGGPYWRPQYCCANYNSTQSMIWTYTTKCYTTPATARYASGFPGFPDQNSCMYDTLYNGNLHQYELETGGSSFGKSYSDPACTISGFDYLWAFVNTNNYTTSNYRTTNTPIRVSCVSNP